MISAAEFLKYLYVFNVPMRNEPGTGTVTNVGTGTGLTGGPITTTGTISLAPIADQNFLANNSGSSAAPGAYPFSTYATYLLNNYVRSPVSPVIQSTASVTIQKGKCYIITYPLVAQLTIPAGFVAGDSFQIIGTAAGVGGWQLNQSAGVQIFWGLRSTTLGVSGFITSGDITDGATFWCYAPDTFVLVQPQGALQLN